MTRGDRKARICRLECGGVRPRRDAPSGMTTFSVPNRALGADDEQLLRAAVAAYPGRYRGESRVHTGSDLKVFVTWCSDHHLDPLNVGRAEIERYVRWLQDVRCYQPSTVSRRLSVVVGFYRVCVIDQILAHSPADYVRGHRYRPSHRLWASGICSRALLTTARLSANRNDFALIAMLGLLGLRIFEACGANIADLGEEHGHGVLKVRGKGSKTVLVPLPPAVARAIELTTEDRAEGPILRNAAGRRMDRHAASRRLVHLSETAGIRLPRIHPLSRSEARFRCCHRSVSPDRSPNPPCASRRNGLSTVSAVRRGSWSARAWGSWSPGRRSGKPSRLRSGSTRPRPPRSAIARQRWPVDGGAAPNSSGGVSAASGPVSTR
jgi:integrase/recombinase XerD